MAEFDGLRAKLYEEALQDFPSAREEDIKVMEKYLNPKEGEKILGLGEGNGLFCPSIAKAIGKEGRYVVTDPSKDQLDNLRNRNSNIEIIQAGAEEICIPNTFDKIWSFGGFHHCPNQTEAMQNVYSSLKTGGYAVICDVFQGTKLSEHFDAQVARYCETGHEVKFMSEPFARTIAYLAGFKDVQIVGLPIKWKFDSEKDLGEFIYKLHAMTKLPGSIEEKIQKTLEGCKKILGVEKETQYLLNWPMKALIAKKEG